MSSPATASYSYSYTETDVEEVARSFLADLKMIANSTRAQIETWAEESAHDIELFCKHGLLAAVDITLEDGFQEIKAVRYEVNVDSGQLKSTRPGGVMWPGTLANPGLVITLIFRTNQAYTNALRLPGLRHSWAPSNRDTSHSSLNGVGGRNYVSGAFGFQRKDFSR